MNKPTLNSCGVVKKPHPANTPPPYYGSEAATTSLALPFRLTTAGLRGTRNCTGCGCSIENDFGDPHPHTTPRILRRIARLIKLLSAWIAHLSAAIVAMLAPLAGWRAYHSTIDIVCIVRFRRMARPRFLRGGERESIGFPLHVDDPIVRNYSSSDRRVVVTGIGLVTSIGRTREAVWQAMQRGESGIRRLVGIQGIPDGLLLGAVADVECEAPNQLKNIPFCRQTASEALADAGIDFERVDRDRFGCSIGAHMGDTDYVAARVGLDRSLTPAAVPWWEQWLPNTACAVVANEFDLRGPRLANSTACASGTIAVLKAVRAIQDGQCDVALAGSSEAIHPLFAAGFYNMGVLADDADPKLACRPFDANRHGFVMGEGAAMLVLESLEHARNRKAAIYAECLGGSTYCDARHITSLATDSDTLSELIRATLRCSHLVPRDVTYISAHGTGTVQNDLLETRGIRGAFGRAASSVCVSANKSMLGHLVNASGSVELAVTTLALRDGFAPPTLNLTHPDPECDLDCIPLLGRVRPLEHALKLSIAFGGHLAAISLRRWTGREARAANSLYQKAA
jgi:3-oxoacyl-(acyl-carrier-protein) synthase